MSNGLGGDAFTRKYNISPLTLVLGQGQIRNVAQYPLRRMTYAPAAFEVAMSNGLGGIAFTRILISWSHEVLPFTPCGLHEFTCNV